MRFVSSIALGLGTISLLTLGLGLAGLLHHGSAVAIICVGIALALTLALKQKTRLSEWLGWAKQPAGWDWLWIAACPFAAIAVVGAMFPAGLLWRGGDPSFYDVVEYHLQVPREWFEAGRIIPLSHNVFSFFPFNVEMHYLLAMHLCGGPWAAMFLAQLMHLAFLALFVVAVYAFALEATLWHVHPVRAEGMERKKDLVSRDFLGTTQPTRAGSPCHGGGLGKLPAITAALAVGTVPWVIQLAPVAYDEGGFLLFGTLAIAWVCRAIWDDLHRTRRLVIAGVFAGFACGAKLTAVPEVLLRWPSFVAHRFSCSSARASGNRRGRYQFSSPSDY